MKYRVTCAGMFIAGELHRRGQEFTIDEENAERMRLRSPHLTFEAINDENIRKADLGRKRAEDGRAGDAQLPSGGGEGEGPKKRGRGRPRKR